MEKNQQKYRRKSKEPKPRQLYAVREAQINKKYDHTNSIIRPQAFGILRPKFCCY